MNVPVWGWSIIAAFILFAVGLYGVLSRRNMLKILIGVEIMSKAILLVFVAAGGINGRLALAQAVVSLIIVIDATIVAIVLALIVNSYRHYGRIDVKRLTRLRG